MGSSSMCTHWNQSQIRYKRFASWDSIAYKMIVVDGIFLFVFELYVSMEIIKYVIAIF